MKSGKRFIVAQNLFIAGKHLKNSGVRKFGVGFLQKLSLKSKIVTHENQFRMAKTIKFREKKGCTKVGGGGGGL